MNATSNHKPCTCELCQPSWTLGVDGMTFQPQSDEPEARQMELETAHWRKVASAWLEQLVPVSG